MDQNKYRAKLLWHSAIIGLASLVVTGAAWAIPITNALKNPGFEDGLNFWSVSAGSAKYVADNVIVQSGNFSARGEESARGSLGRLFQDVTAFLIPGETYEISGWIRTENVSTDGGGVVLGLNYVDQFGVTPFNGFVKEIGDVKGTSDWAFFQSNSFTLPTMPAGTIALWFLTDFNDSSGTAWFDNVALIGPARVPEPATLMLFGLGLAGLGFARRKKA